MQKREHYPHVQLKYEVTHKQISQNKILLNVVVKISNVGNTLLSLKSSKMLIQQVKPLPPSFLAYLDKEHNPLHEGQAEVPWPLIGKKTHEWKPGDFESEPGETGSIRYDFILDVNVETVKIYNFIENVAKRHHPVGWRVTTIYDFQPSTNTNTIIPHHIFQNEEVQDAH